MAGTGPLGIQFGRGSILELSDRLRQIQGELHIFTTIPVLADMKVGEIALGNATEASPVVGFPIGTPAGTGLHAIYAKISEAVILVVSIRAAGGAPHSRLIT
jgi:cobalamin synthase|tara:strand:- start:605 stop:910 length:306 start_codon:yes stop_codon:yes gene_type:complete